MGLFKTPITPKIVNPVTPLADNGVGDVLGAELIINGNFQGTKGQNPTEWTTATSGTAHIDDATPPVGYDQYVKSVSGDGNYDRLEPSHSDYHVTGLTIGATYRVQALVRHVSGNYLNQGLRAFTFTNGLEDFRLTQASGWHWISGDVVATSTSGFTRLYCCLAGNIGDQVDCAKLSLREVLS